MLQKSISTGLAYHWGDNNRFVSAMRNGRTTAVSQDVPDVLGRKTISGDMGNLSSDNKGDES